MHQNTDNWHLHVAINKVHPKTRRNVEPYYDKLRLQEVCVELEIKHGLKPDNHSLQPEQPLNGKPAEMEAHAGRMSFHRWLIENAKDALVRGAVESTNWQQFHAVVARFGAVIKQRGAGLIIAHRDNDRIRVEGQRDRPQPVLQGTDGSLGTIRAAGDRSAGNGARAVTSDADPSATATSTAIRRSTPTRQDQTNPTD